MPKRIIDYEAIYTSTRLFDCPEEIRVEYLWIYGLADGSGSFEMTNLRVIHQKLSTIRPHFTLKRLATCLAAFEKAGLLFVWYYSGKKWAHWVGSTKKGRLPPPSEKSRHYLVCPQPPKQELDAYNSRFTRDPIPDSIRDSIRDKEVEVEVEVDLGSGIGRGIGGGAASSPLPSVEAVTSPRIGFPSIPDSPSQFKPLERRTVCPDCKNEMSEIGFLGHICPARALAQWSKTANRTKL